MPAVAVRILHPEAPSDAGPLSRGLADARQRNAERLRGLFRTAGIPDPQVVGLPADGTSFGDRLRSMVRSLPSGSGLVFLGSGAIPLATAADIRSFVEVASSGEHRALANNRYSADVLSVGRAEPLRDAPDMPSDNALPRWLEEAVGFDVDDLRRRWRLAIDLDSPLDVVVARPAWAGSGIATRTVEDRIRAVRAVAGDRRAELVVVGRSGSATLAWLERTTAARTRFISEERGLRASTAAAFGPDDSGTGRGLRDRTRPPRSILGLALDERGPAALGAVLAELGDAAIVDVRVLLAHRLGADEARWPPAEDRFAADLLLPDPISDPWLRALTRAAVDAPAPVLLGGHTLVGPGLRLMLRGVGAS